MMYIMSRKDCGILCYRPIKLTFFYLCKEDTNDIISKGHYTD